MYFILRITYWFIHHFNEFLVLFSLNCERTFSSIGKGNYALKRWKIFAKISIFTLQLYLSINMSLSHENVIYFITSLCYKTKLFLVFQTDLFLFWNILDLAQKSEVKSSQFVTKIWYHDIPQLCLRWCALLMKRSFCIKENDNRIAYFHGSIILHQTNTSFILYSFSSANM